MRATLARQSGSCKPLLKPRRTTPRTVVIGARPAPLLPQNGLLASTVCIFSNTYVFTIVCSFRRPVVIGAILAPSFHKKVFRASTACTFSKHMVFVCFCENAAFRRDWCSPGHLFEGLGPHASDLGAPKWLPQAPFKATKNNSAYRCDWRSPGAPITSKWVFDLDDVHIFNNVCFCMFLCFSAIRRDWRSPGTHS